MLVRASSERGLGLCISVLLDEECFAIQADKLKEAIGSANMATDLPLRVRCALSVTNFRKIRERFPAAKLDIEHEGTVTLVEQMREERDLYEKESVLGRLVKAGTADRSLLPAYEFKTKPFDHQILGWQFMHTFRFPALFGDCGTGKFFHTETPVLTPLGWKTIGSIDVGDTVFGSNGKPCSVTAVYPQGEMPLYRVTFNDGASCLAGAEHLWRVRSFNDSQRNKPWRTMKTEEIRAAGLRYGTDGKSYRWRIPVVEPIELREVDLPLHPYVLGVLLGDGSITTGTPSWTKNDPCVARRIEPLLPAGHSVNKHQSKARATQWSIVSLGKTENKVTATLRHLCLYGCKSSEKFVPDAYLFSSAGQRLELLQGLLDTDGSSSGSTIEFSSSSLNLANAVAFLVQSLGGRASRSTKQSPAYTYKGEAKIGKPSHRVFLSLPPGTPAFQMERKKTSNTRKIVRTIVSIEPAEPAEAVCISVDSPDKTYVIEHFIVTHNTFIVGTWADSLIKAGEKFVFLVICPVNIIKHAWRADLEKFTDLSMTRLHEPSQYKRAEKRAARFAEDSDVYIVNPETAIRTEKEILKLIKRKKKEGKEFALILDESSRMKSERSAIYKVCKKLRPLASRTTIMTGTPSPNGVGDLWAQFDILDLGATLQPKWTDYRQDTHVNFTMPGVDYHVGKGEKKKKIPVVHWRPRAGSAPLVHDMIKDRMIRFRAEDCLDLPSKQFFRRDVEMTKEQAKTYQEMRDYLYTEFEGSGITARVAAVRAMKLREITGGFVIDDRGKEIPLCKDSPKMLELDSMLEDILGDRLGDHERTPTKALVWTQYQWESRTLTSRYRKYGARGLFGGISSTKKDENISAFKNDKDCKLLVCHPKSAGHGLTLTEANYAFYYGLSYDYDEFYQSARRIARPGQTKPMFFYFLLTPSTIEEMIIAALEEKKSVSNIVTDGPFKRDVFDNLKLMGDQKLNIDLEYAE